MRTRALLAVALLPLAAAAGCVNPDAYESRAACEAPLITLHYGGMDDVDEAELREAFTQARYSWTEVENGYAELLPNDPQVRGVLSFSPGTSAAAPGEGDVSLVISFEGRTEQVAQGTVHRAADEAHAVVEREFPNAELTQRLESTRTAPCGAPPDPVDQRASDEEPSGPPPSTPQQPGS